MDKKTCPYCGYTAHAVSSQDGKYWKYVCENPKCKQTFVVDKETGKVC